MLVLSIASNLGALNLSSEFEWIGSSFAMAVFIAASLVELIAYLVPFFDNLLDTIAGPVAVTAGTILMASTLIDMEPIFKWTLAIIAGGGAAGLIQSLTSLTRGASTITTAGAGNPIISITETSASLGISLLALFSPIVMGMLVIFLLIWSLKKFFYLIKRKRRIK